MNNNFIKATNDYGGFDNHVPAPYIRKTFDLDFDCESATISICGLGFYVLHVNGKDITKGELAPYVSNPDHVAYYDTYDIAPLLKKGKNAIGIILGNGFMNPFGGPIWDFHTAPWRGTPRVALECIIKGGDNTLEITADTSFKVKDSPIRFDEYRMGEYYDANYEIEGWDLPDFDDSDWNNAIVAEAPRGELKLCEADPIKTYKIAKPISIHKTEDGYVYDFGINSAGMLTLNVNARAGQTIEINHGEVLLNGVFFIKNLHFGEPHADKYCYWNKYTASKDGLVEWKPTFVYHGFRYALVRGITDEQATPELLTYHIMSSDVKSIGGFECSVPMVNKIYETVQNSARSNLYYIPTDCPHREKNGWMGDASLSADFMSLMYKMDDTYSEWLVNICKAQNDKGALPGIVPTGGWGFHWGNGPTWDSALFNLPYQLYKTRGNTKAIEICAHSMVRYLEYILTRRSPNGTIAIGLGDWVPVGGGDYPVPLEVTDSVMVMDIAFKASEMLAAIGRTHQSAFAYGIYEDMRETVRRELVDLDTCVVKGNSQSGQAIGVYYDVFEEDEKPLAVEKLVELIHAKNDRFDCGFIGMHCIFHVLSDYGYAELAYKLIMQKGYPSYRHLLDIGETALVEQFVPDGASCGSHNHHFLGDVARWFTTAIAGLNVIDSKTAVIKPCYINEINSASAYYDFPAGRVSVEWNRNDNGIELTVNCCDGVDCDVIANNSNVPVTVKYIR